MRLPAEVTPRSVLRMRVLRKAMRGGPEIYAYSDSVVAASATRPAHPAVRLPELGQHAAVGTRRPGARRGHAGEVPAERRRRRRHRLRDRPAEERLLWVKSWNEWAEGNHLEPDARDGRGWLRGAARRARLRMADIEFSARPLRIAMISYYLPSGSKIGVGYQVHALADELVRRGHHVDVFSECPPVPGARYGHVTCPAHRLAAHLSVRHRAAPDGLLGLRRSARPR